MSWSSNGNQQQPVDRRESYISTQLSSINSQMQALFDELGLSSQEREARERNVYSVISKALESHVDEIKQERDALYEKCVELQSSVQEMLGALKDLDVSLILSNPSIAWSEVKPPYQPFCSQLETAYEQIDSIYSERLVRVNQTLEQLKELATKVDGISVANELMLRDEDLDLSNDHIVELEAEVGRWQEEYSNRVSTVAQHASQIASLWAELGTPQSEIDSNILSCYRSNPEQLGTLTTDMEKLRAKYESLEAEKESRVDRLEGLKQQIQALWEKLSEDTDYATNFERSNRGLALTVLQAHERELERLNEKKKQHIHVFIQDARETLKELWEKLYFSEDETLEFTPAWTEIYTDASLDAHETEIARLQSLVEQRKPILSLIDEYYSIQADSKALEASAQDSSRLLSKGPGKRDPSRLLREEQMRKRIAKKLPKVIQELRAALNAWTEKNGIPFLINGHDFNQELQEEQAKRDPRGRMKNKTVGNPHGPTRSASPQKTAPRSPVKKQPPASRTRPVSPAKSTYSTFSSYSADSATTASTSTFKRPVHPPPSASSNTTASSGTRIPSAPAIPRTKSKNQLQHQQSGYKRNFSQPQQQQQQQQQPSFKFPVSKGGTHQPTSQPSKPKLLGKENHQLRIPSVTGSTTSSENWEVLDEGSSSEDEIFDSNYHKWREDAMRKLASGGTNEEPNDKSRVSEFNWDKDVF